MEESYRPYRFLHEDLGSSQSAFIQKIKTCEIIILVYIIKKLSARHCFLHQRQELYFQYIIRETKSGEATPRCAHESFDVGPGNLT